MKRKKKSMGFYCIYNFCFSHRSDLLIRKDPHNSFIALITHTTPNYTHHQRDRRYQNPLNRNASPLPYPTAYRLCPLGAFFPTRVGANALFHKSSHDRLRHIAVASANRWNRWQNPGSSWQAHSGAPIQPLRSRSHSLSNVQALP